MDKNTQLFQYNLDWKTFQRVLYYTKKYYGMDALYFYEANPFKREEEFVLICFRQATEFFVRDETIAKYIEPKMRKKYSFGYFDVSTGLLSEQS